METVSNVRSCGCKGIRVCLVCEPSKQQLKTQTLDDIADIFQEFVYCYKCEKAWELSTNKHPEHAGKSLEFPGISIVPEFITKEEEKLIMKKIDETCWKESQSGRLKQDYGPKVNFKKKKVNVQQFTGLPPFSCDLYERMSSLKTLKNFIPVELCNLDYHPSRGSSIDPHFDDFWLWGERLVTLNLLSDTYLAMTCEKNNSGESINNVLVRIPLAQRSLVILYGEARYVWKHSIPRSAISARRIAITLRELSNEFEAGGTLREQGNELKKRAMTFQGAAVQ